MRRGGNMCSDGGAGLRYSVGPSVLGTERKTDQTRLDLVFFGETGSRLINQEWEWGENIKCSERGKSMKQLPRMVNGLEQCGRIASRHWGPNEVMNWQWAEAARLSIFPSEVQVQRCGQSSKEAGIARIGTLPGKYHEERGARESRIYVREWFQWWTMKHSMRKASKEIRECEESEKVIGFGDCVSQCGWRVTGLG